MKIIQVNNYGYLKGGSEKVFFETIKVLEENGHEVRAFCMSNDNNFINKNIIQVPIPPYENRNNIWETILSIKNFFYNKKVEKEFVKLIEEFKPDIIHIHIIYGRLTNAIIKVANKYNIPVVQSVHEFRLLCPIYTCLDNKHNICEKCANSMFNFDCIINKCCKHSILNSILVAVECKFRDCFFNHQKKISGFIMVSQFIKNKHLEYFPEIKDKCFQVYNSIDIHSYSKFISYNKFQEDRYYLYFGRLSYEKGVLSLVEYFRKHPDIKLRIVGTGPLLQTLQLFVKEQSLINIEILGYKSGEDLYKEIANAYFTIVPSEWYENNPLTIIESLALGTPVIGNKIGGIPEIIIHSKTGYIYDYMIDGDFERCMNDSHHLTEKEYQDMMAECMEEACDKFSNVNYYKKLIDVYNYTLKLQ